MPQVQVLPSVPTFGGDLARALAGAGSNIAQGFAERGKQKKIASYTNAITDPKTSPIERLKATEAYTRAVGPEQAKNTLPLFYEYLDLAQQQPQQTAGGGGMPLGQPSAPPSALPGNQPGIPQGPSAPITAQTQPQGIQKAPSPTGQTETERELQEIAAKRETALRKSKMPYASQAHIEEYKSLGKEESRLKKQLVEEKKIAADKAEEQKEWKAAFDTLDENLSYTGFVPHTKFGKTREKREAFDTAAFQIEKFARKQHTSGPLSKAVYESLLSKLPSAKESEAVNRGRIEGWRAVLLKDYVKPSGEIKKIDVLSPQGKVLKIPANEVEAAIQSGGKLL